MKRILIAGSLIAALGAASFAVSAGEHGYGRYLAKGDAAGADLQALRAHLQRSGLVVLGESRPASGRFEDTVLVIRPAGNFSAAAQRHDDDDDDDDHKPRGGRW